MGISIEKLKCVVFVLASNVHLLIVLEKNYKRIRKYFQNIFKIKSREALIEIMEFGQN